MKSSKELYIETHEIISIPEWSGEKTQVKQLTPAQQCGKAALLEQKYFEKKRGLIKAVQTQLRNDLQIINIPLNVVTDLLTYHINNPNAEVFFIDPLGQRSWPERPNSKTFKYPHKTIKNPFK